VTGGTPVVVVSDHKRVTPDAGELLLAGGTPGVVVSDHQTVTPEPAGLVVTGGTPAVAVSDHKVIRPGAAELSIDGGVPFVGLPRSIVPGPAELVVTGSAPEVTVAPISGEFSDVVLYILGNDEEFAWTLAVSDHGVQSVAEPLGDHPTIQTMSVNPSTGTVYLLEADTESAVLQYDSGVLSTLLELPTDSNPVGIAATHHTGLGADIVVVSMDSDEGVGLFLHVIGTPGLTKIADGFESIFRIAVTPAGDKIVMTDGESVSLVNVSNGAVTPVTVDREGGIEVVAATNAALYVYYWDLVELVKVEDGITTSVADTMPGGIVHCVVDASTDIVYVICGQDETGPIWKIDDAVISELAVTAVQWPFRVGIAPAT